MKSAALCVYLGLVLACFGCSSGSQPASLTLSTGSTQAIDNGQSVNIMVSGAGTQGVTWSLTGPGSLSNQTSTSVTYNAPAVGAIVPAKAKASGAKAQSTFSVGADPTATVTATSVASASQTASVTISVTPPPSITTTSLPAGTEGTAYNQTIITSGGAGTLTLTVSTGTLPAGLSMDSSGHITGMPTGPNGTASFTVKVTDSSNGGAQSSPQNLSITINLPPAPSISTTSLPTGVEGTAYNQTIAATGGLTPYAFSVSVGTLPAGLALNSGTGAITGTPTGPNGASNFTVKLTDKSNPAQSATQNLSITINLPPAPVISPTTLPNGNVGSPYSQILSLSGGLGPAFTWTVSSGTLPAGLALTSTNATAKISGTPTTAQTNVAFTIQVTDSSLPAQSALQSYTVTINPPAPLSITTTSLTNGAYNTAYSAAISATGGIAPYSFSLDAASGPLPAGLALSQNNNQGVISGTPTAAGVFTNIIIDVHDSQTPTPATAKMTFTLTVTAPAIVISPSSLPAGTVSSPYTVNVTATGGVSPYTFSLDAASSALPAGLSFASNATMATISGTPTTAATTTNIIIDVKDSEQPAVTQKMTYSITISAAGISITSTSPLPNATLGSSYSTMLTVTGGIAPYTWSLHTGSTLPAGLALTSATISGTPTTTGTFQFTLNVNDSTTPTPLTASATFLLTVSGSSTLNCPAVVNLTLCGAYGLGIQGFVGTSGPAIIGGSFLADNSGHIVSGVEDINSASGGQAGVSITGGGYVMDPSGDGRGVLTLIDSNAGSRTFRFVVESAANPGIGAIVEFDASGTLAAGVFAGPGTTPFATIPANAVLGIVLEGYNSAGQRAGMLGEFQVGSSGCNGASGSFNSLTGEHIVTNTAGTVNTALTATGSCTAPDPNTGRGAMQITISGGTPYTNSTLHFFYYASGTATTGLQGLLVGEADAIGANQPILSGLAEVAGSSGGGFANCAVPAACILAGHGTTDGTITTGHAVAFLARGSGTPVTQTTGTITGVLDENFGGTITTAGAWPYMAYADDANGVGTLTGTGPTIHFIQDGRFMDESVSVIVGDTNVQNTTTIENPGAAYIFGESIGSSAVGATPSVPHVAGVVTSSGATTGNFAGSIDVSSGAGLTVGFTPSGNYTINSTTGRGTGMANFSGGANSVSVVMYGNRHRRFSVLDVQSNNPFLLGARLQ